MTRTLLDVVKKEGMAEGIQQGELQKAIETAKNMLKDEIKQLSDK